jgi:hypothetical protein
LFLGNDDGMLNATREHVDEEALVKGCKNSDRRPQDAVGLASADDDA